MNDIFLSYAAEDRERARGVATAFEAKGFSVWWDREIPPGKSFDQVIEAELNSARSVVVLWSQHSVKSRWVKTEAAAAADRNCLVPILIDDVPIPFEFRRIQTARLVHWEDPSADAEFPLIMDAIRETTSRPATAHPHVPGGAHESAVVSAGASRRRPRMGMAAVFVLALVLLAAVFLIWRPGSTPSEADSPAIDAAGAAGETPQPSPATSGSPPASASSSGTSLAGAIKLNIGDRVSDGKPMQGAGSIEDQFGEDVYVFNARPRQNVFFRIVEVGQGMSQVRWSVSDELGMEVFNTCLACGHPGVHMLVRGGQYVLRVGSTSDPSRGIYSFQILDVPEPNRFQIKIGATVKDDVPGPGAGVIETPGVEDVYTFDAPPRQRVFIRVREQTPGISQLRLRLSDQNNMTILEQCLACGQYPPQLLVNGGTYTITVGTRTDPSTGSYSFELGTP